MCPPAASPTANIGFNCTSAELFGLLEKMTHGSPPPCNVIADINPYIYMPSNLPEGVWYYSNSKENVGSEHGLWKAIGEACEIFSNSSIIGWRTTLEFYEGEVPCECKTDWVMQEYSITQKSPCEDCEMKKLDNMQAAGTLCRIFLDGLQSSIHDKRQSKSGADTDPDTETHVNLNQQIILNAETDSRKGSRSLSLVNKDDKIEEFAGAERLPNHHAENMPEIDCLSTGDYLELLDLVNPASSSSSSENSSCLSMSSDEYFDSLALLRDLESGNNQDLERKDTRCNFSVTESNRPDDVVIFSATPGALTNFTGSMLQTGEITETDHSASTSAKARGGVVGKSSKHARKGQKAEYPDVGPSSNSRNMAESSSHHIGAPYGKKKSAVGRMKKLKRKYLCFMPF